MASRDDLQRFLDRGGDVRLVHDLGSGELAGIAYRSRGAWDWQEVKLEGATRRFFDQTAIDLITPQIAQAIPGISPPTRLDDILAVATAALSPQVIVGKLANAAGQVVAHHLGLSPVAPVVGKVAEQIVAAAPFPASAPGRVLGAARVDVVMYDLRAGHLSATVRDFTVDRIDDRINDLTRGVTRPEVRDIQDVLRRPEPPPPPAPKEPGAPRPGRFPRLGGL